ncbi:hypothetical protein Tco_1024715 [Tanacetum coccineum]
MLSPVISKDSTQIAPAKAVEIKEKIRKDFERKFTGGKKKAAEEAAKKRKRTEIESLGKTTRQSAKKQQLEKKEKEQVNKRKRDEGDDKKKLEKKFKPLRAKTTVKPLYDATKSLSPERKSKIREMGFGCMLDFPFQKIPGKLTYFVLKDLDTEKMEVKLPDIISDFDWCKFIWDHIQTSKIGWDDRTTENWYYGPNALLMLIYLDYTKFDGMVMMPCKWPAIRSLTNQDAFDRDILEMHQGEFERLVEVIEDNDEENVNETDVEKQKLKEENMKMDELFYEDEKFALFVKRFKEEFNTSLDRDENQVGTSGAGHGNDDDDEDGAGHGNDEDGVGHGNDDGNCGDVDGAGHGNDDGNGGDVDGVGHGNSASHGNVAKEKEDKEDAAKKKEKAEKLAAALNKEQAEKLAAEKQDAEKAKKEKAGKEAKAKAEKKKEAEKIAAAKAAEIQVVEREKATKKKSHAKKKQAVAKNNEAEAAVKKVQLKMFGKGQESAEKIRAKRITKPSLYLKSPFMNKMVKTQDELDEDEILYVRSIFCMQGDISKVVFDDSKGTIAHRKEMESLAPGIMIENR